MTKPPQKTRNQQRSTKKSNPIIIMVECFFSPRKCSGGKLKKNKSRLKAKQKLKSKSHLAGPSVLRHPKNNSKKEAPKKRRRTSLLLKNISATTKPFGGAVRFEATSSWANRPWPRRSSRSAGSSFESSKHVTVANGGAEGTWCVFCGVFFFWMVL